MVLTQNLMDNLTLLRRLCAPSTDVIFREFMTNGKGAAVAFLDVTVDSEAQRDLMSELLKKREEPCDLDTLLETVIPIFGATLTDNTQGCLEAIFRGDTVLLLEGDHRALLLATAKWDKRAIAEPPTSTVLKGPREGFTEDLRSNLTQVRRRLQTPDLVFRHIFIGEKSHTDVVVMYLNGVAPRKLIRQIENKITSVRFDGVLDVNYLIELIEPRSNSLFQQTATMEKPDIVTSKLLEGRVVIMVNGSPIAASVPFVLLEQFQQAEDYYTRRKGSTFLRILRLFGAFIGIFLPGLYVSVQVFHYSVIPLSFLYSLMNAVQGLPMSPLMEMLFVLFVFEVLHEASFRMPKYVGMAMSVVGALVLGDTAVKAGLISSPAILVVAISAIALYAVPEMIDAFKIIRIGVTLVGGLAGVWGICLFGIALLIYLCAMEAYGTPYLAPFAPFIRNDMQDGLNRGLLSDMRMRPRSFKQPDRVRRGRREI